MQWLLTCSSLVVMHLFLSIGLPEISAEASQKTMGVYGRTYNSLKSMNDPKRVKGRTQMLFKPFGTKLFEDVNPAISDVDEFVADPIVGRRSKRETPTGFGTSEDDEADTGSSGDSLDIDGSNEESSDFGKVMREILGSNNDGISDTLLSRIASLGNDKDVLSDTVTTVDIDSTK